MKILVDGMSVHKGGIGSLLLNFARYNRLHSNALEFHFLVPEGSENLETLLEMGYRCYIVPSITQVMAYRRVIQQAFKENRYDYLWLNNTSKANALLPVYAVKKGARLITHPHGVSNEEQGIKRMIFDLLDKLNHQRYLKRVSLPFACSYKAAERYYRGSDLLERVTVINNGILVDHFAFQKEPRLAIRKELGIKEDEVVLGAIGRLSEVKNFGFLIDLVCRLPDRYRCVILGEGPERTSLLTMAETAGLGGRFILAGQVDNVAEYLCAFDLFLMPSLHEGMPFAVIEAQASGLPCILSDTISKECAVSDLVQFAALNDATAWEAAVQKISTGPEERGQYADVIRRSGYSIEESYAVFKKALGGIECQNTQD